MTISDALKTKIQKEVEELTLSINSIVETFRSMKSPLVESHEQVPKATVQLDKIADQTEEATHRMLDKIEEVTQRETKIINCLKALPAKASGKLSVNKAPLGPIIEMAQVNLDDVFLVMDALQFQDITSQQIQHAAALLEDIEVKLKSIVSIVTGEKSDDNANPGNGKKRVYDPHAEFQDKRTDQNDIDDIFERAGK